MGRLDRDQEMNGHWTATARLRTDDEIEQLLPLYVLNQLSPEEKGVVDDALVASPDLRARFAHVQRYDLATVAAVPAREDRPTRYL